MTISVVVTGASGFIGSSLCEKLEKDNNFSVIKVSRKLPEKPGLIKVDSYKKTPTADILIHLAEDSDRTKVNNIGDIYRKNTGIIMDSLINKGFKKIVYCSSSLVYGNKGENPYSEKTLTFASDTYSLSKLENEKRVLDSNGVVVRFSNVIGIGMSNKNVLSDIIKQLSNKTPIKIRNLRPIQDFIFIEDALEALISLINTNISGVYNIGSGKGTSIEKLIKTVLDIVGQNDRVIQSNSNDSEYSYNVLNTSNIMNKTTWKPNHNLRESLKKIIRNYE